MRSNILFVLIVETFLCDVLGTYFDDNWLSL